MPINSPEIQEYMRVTPRARVAYERRKYSIMLLDEAVKRAGEVGLTQSAAETGVKADAIKKHAQRQRQAKGIGADDELSRNARAKYDLATRKKCVVLALRYREATASSYPECYRRAAVNLGLPAIAGRTIRNQYLAGTLVI